MDLTLTVIESPLDTNMLNHTKAFRTEGGSFGRSDNNNWVLPDNERVVSSQHAQITFKNGSYVLIDNSTNGTYLNEADSPIGQGNELPLSNGDIIGAGQYKLRVTIKAPQQPAASLPKGLETADFLDGSDKTTFNPELAAKHQATAEAEGLDNWLEPGKAATQQPAHSDAQKWGHVSSVDTASNITSSTGLNFGNQHIDTSPLQPVAADPLAGFDNPLSSTPHSSALDPLAAIDQAANLQPVSQAAWEDDDEWWKSGSEADNATATAQIMHDPVAIKNASASDLRAELTPEAASTTASSATTLDSLEMQSHAQHIQPTNIDEALAIPQGNVTAAPQSQQPQPQPPVAQTPISQPPVAQQSAPQPTMPHIPVTQALHQSQVAVTTPPPAPQQPAVMVNPAQHEQTVQHNQPRATPSTDTQQLANALGLSNLQTQQLTQLVPEAAAIISETANRLIDLLRARSSIKNELRVERTMIQAVDNNPLKFSATAHDALKAMFSADNQAFLRPQDAIRDSFDDLSDHQVAVLAGMRAAYDNMLLHFSPTKLEKRFNANSGLLTNKKAKNWEAFEEYFAMLTRDHETSYNTLFGEEFAAIYEKQLAELKNARSLTRSR
jgi:type VI secretion system protein